MKKIFSTIILTALISMTLTACSDVNENDNSTEQSAVNSGDNSNSSNNLLSGKTISADVVETVRSSYGSEDRPLYDMKILDLDFDGEEELLVLTAQANPKVFEVWEKVGEKMELSYSFGAGKINFIDKIELNESKINGEKVYLFSFAYDEDGTMKADEVLSVIRKTADDYDVEHLLSRGTLTYSNIAEPFTKEFYRKGWSKYDIGLDTDYGDITKEEYYKLYEEYTGTVSG